MHDDTCMLWLPLVAVCLLGGLAIKYVFNPTSFSRTFFWFCIFVICVASAVFLLRPILGS